MERLRAHGLQAVEQGLTTVLQVQSWHSPALSALFAGTEHVVGTTFYVTVLPAIFYSGQLRLGRQLTLLLATAVFVGNGLKDLLGLPRPFELSQRVQLLHGKGGGATAAEHSLEYGLPSTHVLNSLCMCGYLAHHFEASMSVWVVIFVWVALVGLGRLYLGMHTPVDVAAGALIGVVLTSIWAAVDDGLEAWISDAGAPVVATQAVVAVAAAVAYPSPRKATPSKGFAMAFNGVVLGVLAGGRQVRAAEHSAGAAATLGRCLLGFPLILTAKAAAKAAAKRALGETGPGPAGAKPGSAADVAVTVASYAALGFAVTDTSFRAFGVLAPDAFPVAS